MNNSTINTVMTPCAKVSLINEDKDNRLILDVLHTVEKLDSMSAISKHTEMIESVFWDGENTLLTISDIREVKTTSKEVRAFLSSAEGLQWCKACALIVDKGLSKMIGNLFLKFNRFGVPMKMFSEREKAMEWLLKHH